jgi:hypothetical protein
MPRDPTATINIDDGSAIGRSVLGWCPSSCGVDGWVLKQENCIAHFAGNDRFMQRSLLIPGYVVRHGIRSKTATYHRKCGGVSV